MRTLKLVTLACFVTFAVWTISPFSVAEGQDQKDDKGVSESSDIIAATTNNPDEEAETGFDTEPIGVVDPLRPDHEANLEVFAEEEFVADGLGPVFNAPACGQCHTTPVVGGSSQITELRAGNFDGRVFTDPLDGRADNLIHSRAIDPKIIELVPSDTNVRTFRASLQVLGLGFIEAVAEQRIRDIAANQPFRSGGRIRGQVIEVPVLEAQPTRPGATRVGRFGWKNQHASLVSFSGDAYLNEMGITTPDELGFLETENTSNGNSVAAFDTVPDPEDDGEDLFIFAAFMRATKAPPRDAALAATQAARDGAELFNQIGCAICHLPTLRTVPTGSVINDGTFVVPAPLGGKTFHPFTDLLLHDVGTGDGIVQNGGQSTRNKIRTVPLWGLRTRNRLMHDGLSLTIIDAIRRHGGEASFVTDNFNRLSSTNRSKVLTFLRSL